MNGDEIKLKCLELAKHIAENESSLPPTAERIVEVAYKLLEFIQKP